MVLPWAKICNNHLQLFLSFSFSCTGPNETALPCCKFWLIFVFTRRGRCWLICGRRGANVSEASGAESCWGGSLTKTNTNRSALNFNPSRNCNILLCTVTVSCMLYSRISAHWKRPASGETKYNLFAVNWYLCFMCGICCFHSKLVAVLKNSLMITYISDILVWLLQQHRQMVGLYQVWNNFYHENCTCLRNY